MTRPDGLRRFYGFQICPNDPRINKETIFWKRERDTACILGLGRDENGGPTANPHYYDPIPEEVYRVVRNHIEKIYRHNKRVRNVEYMWSRKGRQTGI